MVSDRAHDLCENRGGCPGPSFPNSPYGLCGRKATSNLNMVSDRAQDLCENRGGFLGLSVPNGPYGLCGRKATSNLNMVSELRSCVKVEKDVLGPSSLRIPTVSVDVRQQRRNKHVAITMELDGAAHVETDTEQSAAVAYYSLNHCLKKTGFGAWFSANCSLQPRNLLVDDRKQMIMSVIIIWRHVNYLGRLFRKQTVRG